MAGFLFDLDQSSICSRDIQKMEGLIRQLLANSSKNIRYCQEADELHDEVEKYFPAGFLVFHRLDIEQQQIPRPKYKQRRKIYYSGKKKRHTAVKTQIMVNNRSGFIIHKTAKMKGHRHDYNIYKENHPVTPKQVVNVFDLGYLGVEKDFPKHYCHPYQTERKEIWN